MRPPIAWYGGKQRLARRIAERVMAVPHKIYVEPFAGGAAVLFAKPRQEGSPSDYREVVNDLNQELITFYRVAQDPAQSARLLAMIDGTLYSRAEYRRACAICKSPDGHDDVTRAWALFVGSRQAFAHNVCKGWAFSLKTQNSASTWYNAKKRLLEQAARLDGVHVECDDALNIIKRWDSPETLFYCDPPYPGTNQGHYKGYTQADFAALVETLAGIQGRFILSNYPQPGIPDGWKMEVFNATMSAANGRHRKGMDVSRKECLWSNPGQLF